MHFVYSNGLKDGPIADQIHTMLVYYDDEFYPPLSSRQSSTQSNLDAAENEKDGSAPNTVDEYFSELRKQGFILAMDKDVVAGFLSFRQDYARTELGGDKEPCTYVTTVLVNKEYRGLRLTYDLYNELFAFSIDEGGTLNPIATRTWQCDDPKNKVESNDAHIHILKELGFKLVKTLYSDRGPGINTVYFKKTFSEEQFGFFQRLKSTQTLNAFMISILLIVLTIASAVAYAFIDMNEIVSELLLAFTTSLLVSAICLIIDTVSQYKLAKNEEYLHDMKHLGIEGLSFDKQLLLIDKIHNAQNTIYLTGVRHILNASMAAYIQRASAKGIKIQVLSSPPWMDAYGLIYDDQEKTLNNYIKLFRMMLICDETSECREVTDNCDFRFSNKPFFNDIYIVDDALITSPYSYYGKKGAGNAEVITARDFFTIITRNDSELYENMRNEYDTLWDTAEYTLDKEKFIELFPDTSYLYRSDETDPEKRHAEKLEKYAENTEKIRACMIEVQSE